MTEDSIHQKWQTTRRDHPSKIKKRLNPRYDYGMTTVHSWFTISEFLKKKLLKISAIKQYDKKYIIDTNNTYRCRGRSVAKL